MKAAQDFNYKVALASGLKSLQAGRLRQAEEQFRYLVSKFPGLDGGYRGLAKVLIELEDRPAAVGILRDGASGLAKAGQRDGAIALLRDALALDPLDHGSHRRLSAALSLTGDLDGAVSELHRYVDAQLVMGNVDHARSEIQYALERFGAHPRLVALAKRNSVDLAAEPAAALEERSNGTPFERPGIFEGLAPMELEPEAEKDPSTAEARSAVLIARRDPRAGAVALEAAEWHLLEGRTNAAADLLLQLISSDLAPNEAQLLLAELGRSAGKPELAKQKCELLARVLRLQGNEKRAGEVERLAEGV